MEAVEVVKVEVAVWGEADEHSVPKVNASARAVERQCRTSREYRVSK